MNFATVDASRLAFLASPLGLEPGQFPAFVIHDIQLDETHPFGQGAEMTNEGIQAFVEDFFSKTRDNKASISATATATITPESDSDQVVSRPRPSLWVEQGMLDETLTALQTRLHDEM